MDLKASVVGLIHGIAVPVTIYGHHVDAPERAVGVALDRVVDWMGNNVDPRQFDDQGAAFEDALLNALAEEIYEGDYR